MPVLSFDPQSLYQGNIKKYEKRLTNPMMKFNDRGLIFVTWYQVRDDSSVYDAGFGQSDELLGSRSGIRYNKIEHLGVSLMNETDVNVNEEVQGVLDISQEGSVLIFPNTIIPNPDKDYFIIEHLQMRGVFRVTGVDYDHMRVDGYRKCDYILEGTDTEILEQLEKQTVETFIMKYEDFGTDVSPIIRKDHAEYIKKLEFMYEDMVSMYLDTFYNDRHECLMWKNPVTKHWIYDECLQWFVSKNSLLSIPNSASFTIFDRKLEDEKFNSYYNRSMWRWVERDAPQEHLTVFPYIIRNSGGYRDSSFYEWGHLDIDILWPYNQVNSAGNVTSGCYIDPHMYQVLTGVQPPLSSYEKVFFLFVNGQLKQSEQIPLTLYQELLDGCDSQQLFVYTPIILYIMRLAMKFR